MEIPSKVKIGYQNYNVNIIDGNLVDDNKVCYGNIDYDKSNINISDLYSEDQKKCTFIHECLHGIDDIMEINLDEDQIRKLGKGLYQFIKDNSEIFNEKSVGGFSPSLGKQYFNQGKSECNIEEIVKCVAEKMKEALINIKS